MNDGGKKGAKLLNGQSRQAIDSSSPAPYRIVEETSIRKSALAQFYHGRRGRALEA